MRTLEEEEKVKVVVYDVSRQLKDAQELTEEESFPKLEELEL